MKIIVLKGLNLKMMKRIKEIGSNIVYVFLGCLLVIWFIIGMVNFLGIEAEAKRVIYEETSIKLIEKYNFDYSGVYSFIDKETNKDYLIFIDTNNASGRSIFVIER